MAFFSAKTVKSVLPKGWRVRLRNFYWRRGNPLLPRQRLESILNANMLGEKLRDDRRMLQLLTLLVTQDQQSESIPGEQRPEDRMRKYEFKVHSQNGEDGILLYIFSRIGVTNRCFVEFGIGTGQECNTSNLSLNCGWHGMLMDADSDLVSIARNFYERRLTDRTLNDPWQDNFFWNRQNDRAQRVKIVACSVTKDNINEVLQANGIEGEIDLLSIDIDGIDYWVWKAINVINPRVVVIEYNATLGYKKSLVVRYDENFDRHQKHASNFYHGASLSALTKLANAKGYVLVGCDSTGVNAFFVRKDACGHKLNEVSVQKAFCPHARRLEKLTLEEQFKLVHNLDWVEV